MQIEAHIAYNKGRQSVELGWAAVDCPYSDKEARLNWFQGRRDVIREDQLDADFEWDSEGE